MNFNAFIFLIICCFAIFQPQTAKSQESNIRKTQNLTLKSAEDMFIANNLQILIQKWGIKSAEGSLKQAGLGINPNISFEQNIFNQYTHKVLDFTSTGNFGIQIQQLFRLAGKKDKEIELSKINVETQQIILTDLLRNLKNTLRTNLINLYYLRNETGFYDTLITSVKSALEAAQKNYDKHQLLLSELLRLKSLLLQLENEVVDIRNQINLIQNDLVVLFNDTSSVKSDYVVVLDSIELKSFSLKNLKIKDLYQSAFENRTDIKISDNNRKYDELNLSLQQATAYPDLNLGLLYSKAGSYIPDYFAVTMSIDLPIFNRNQGNIESAASNIEADKINKQLLMKQIEHDVSTYYNKAVLYENLYNEFESNILDKYKQLVESMNSNYENRNITIIEFSDFYESYKNSMIQLNQIQLQRASAYESLNFVTGKTIFNP